MYYRKTYRLLHYWNVSLSFSALFSDHRRTQNVGNMKFMHFCVAVKYTCHTCESFHSSLYLAMVRTQNTFRNFPCFHFRTVPVSKSSRLRGITFFVMIQVMLHPKNSEKGKTFKFQCFFLSKKVEVLSAALLGAVFETLLVFGWPSRHIRWQLKLRQGRNLLIGVCVCGERVEEAAELSSSRMIQCDHSWWFSCPARTGFRVFLAICEIVSNQWCGWLEIAEPPFDPCS